MGGETVMLDMVRLLLKCGAIVSDAEDRQSVAGAFPGGQ
jgi:hypothetical protein